MLALTIEGITELVQDGDLEVAMRRYWEARQGGDHTAKLERAACEPDNDPSPPVAPGAISKVAADRVATHESWLDEAGFSLPPPIYAPGTKVLAVGDDNFRLERQRVESLPRFEDAAARVLHQISQEDRCDLPVKLSEIVMNDVGELLVNDRPFAMRVEPSAFRQFVTAAGIGSGASYLAEKCAPMLRARNVNRQVRALPERDLVLRTRLTPDGRRAIYAAVTPKYAPVDSHLVLLAVGELLADSRAEMIYDGSGIRANALWMPDQVVDLAAGDIFKVGVRIESDDTGRGRIRVSGVVWRNRCLNLIVIAEGEVETVSVVHKGSPERILLEVKNGVERARSTVGRFLEAWGHARTVKIAPEDTLRAWVDEKRLYPWGLRERDLVVQSLLRAWEKEPGDTLADAVNAVTRAAHENTEWSMDVRDQLERQAARLVLVAA